MDRKNYKNFIVLPYLYFTFLSTGMILACGYLISTTKGPIKSYASELKENDAIKVNISKDVDLNIELTEKKTTDLRAKKIDQYFANKKSPLSGYGEVFVREADKNQIDWRLLAAIAMKESGGGKSKTANETNNLFGWGFNDDPSKNDPAIHNHDSYEHGITLVSQKLRESYYDKGLKTVDEIVTKYTPASVRAAGGVAENSTWSINVKQFMEAINNIEL